MEYTLKLSSIPNEWYCGDLPGTLQYGKDAALLTAMTIPIGDPHAVFTHVDPTDAIKARLLPKTKTAGSLMNWTLLMAMERTQDGVIWLKGVLQNNTTGAIALMTASPGSEHFTRLGHRAIRSNAMGWYVGHYRMSAPLSFWKELKTRLDVTQ